VHDETRREKEREREAKREGDAKIEMGETARGKEQIAKRKEERETH
jgi:hypothetical protein